MTYPKQSVGVPPGTSVCVILPDGALEPVRGRILRNDIQSPFTVVIQLEDGRILTDGECLWYEARRDAEKIHEHRNTEQGNYIQRLLAGSSR